MEGMGCKKALFTLLLGHVITALALEVPLDPKLRQGLPQPPTITHQSPKNYIIDPRENIVVHCEAKGKPHPSFSWTRNGTTFDIDKESKVRMKQNSGTLVIDISGGKAEAYEGVYQCTATNEYGSAISNNIVIRQSRSPLWSKEKIDQIVVQEGASMVLPCRPPAGLPSPTVFWMDNIFQRLPQSSRVSQALNGDLYFSNVLRGDTRNDYICYARFPHTQTIQQKQPIDVRVFNLDAINETMEALFNDTDFFGDSPVGERPPNFLIPTGSTSSKMVLRGEVLELECIAEGLPTPDMSWHKLDGDLPAGRVMFESFHKTLRIRNVSEADAGDYRCIAKNHLGSVHHTITVVVKAAPYWVRAPKNLILAPDEKGDISCNALGDPKPDVTWLMNGIPIENSPKDPSRHVEGDTIIFTNTQIGSSAVYQCNVSNTYGYLLANAFVNVLTQPPRVLTPPSSVYQVITNTPAFLDCASFGSPLPAITWFKDSHSSIQPVKPFVLHENGTLEITVAHMANGGRYTCVAMNTLGKTENQVYLEVKEPTKIFKQKGDKIVQRNRDVVFECKVSHDPSLTPIMTWLKDNEALPHDERYVVGDDRLTISDVTEEDEGVYTCIVNTTLDLDSAKTKLTVVEATPAPPVFYEKPEPPMDLELTDPRERSIQLTWIAGDDNNSPIQKFIIQYEDSLHQSGVWHSLSEVPGNKPTAHITLSPYVHYTFRVLAVNQVGTSLPSAPSKSYRTKPAAPDENPSEVEGFGTEHNNLVITWKPLTGLQSNGPGLRYKVSWRQKDVETDWDSEVVADVSRFEVSGTPTFVLYEVKVQAVNDLGSAPEPEVVLGYSGEDLPLVAPSNVKFRVENSTLAEVHWDPVPLQLVRGHMMGYKVYYWKERSLDEHHRHHQHEEQRILTFSGNRTRGKLPGLHPFTLYTFNVRVLNGKGEGPASPNKHFETPVGVPGAPAFLNFLNPSEDSLTAEWAPPAERNGPLVGYILKYQTVNNTGDFGPLVEVSVAANETSHTLSSLRYGTRYKFYISARTAAGTGRARTNEAMTIVDEVPPAAPAFSNVSVSLGEDGTVVSWEYWGPDRNIFVEYAVENSKEDWRREFVNGSQSHLIRGLKPGTPYSVRVVARDQAGEEVHSTEELLITVPAIASRQVDIATQGWFIGLMCAIALLILVLLIVCFIKRNKGGKYPVKEKEDAHPDPEIQPMKDDDGIFGEYSDFEDHKPLKCSRTPSDRTVKKDDSDDSLVDYGDGGDGQFNEDGSFIGQYSGKKERDPPEAIESSEAPSPVNAMNTLV